MYAAHDFPLNHITAGRARLYRVTGVMTVYCLADERKRETCSKRWNSRPSASCCIARTLLDVILKPGQASPNYQRLITPVFIPPQVIALPLDHTLNAGTVSNFFSFFPPYQGSWLKWCSVSHSSSHCWEFGYLKVSGILPPVGPDHCDTSFHASFSSSLPHNYK